MVVFISKAKYSYFFGHRYQSNLTEQLPLREAHSKKKKKKKELFEIYKHYNSSACITTPL